MDWILERPGSEAWREALAKEKELEQAKVMDLEKARIKDFEKEQPAKR